MRGSSHPALLDLNRWGVTFSYCLLFRSRNTMLFSFSCMTQVPPSRSTPSDALRKDPRWLHRSHDGRTAATIETHLFAIARDANISSTAFPPHPPLPLLSSTRHLATKATGARATRDNSMPRHQRQGRRQPKRSSGSQRQWQYGAHALAADAGRGGGGSSVERIGAAGAWQCAGRLGELDRVDDPFSKNPASQLMTYIIFYTIHISQRGGAHHKI